MSVDRLRLALGLSVDALDIASWPRVDIGVVPKEKRDCFKRRVKACELYCAGELSAAAVALRVGLSAREVLRVTHAALRVHEDGQVYGQRGLIPYLPSGEYERHAPEGQGTAGLFQQLLNRFPEIRARIKSAYCKEAMRLIDIHREMIEMLKERGIKPTQYPLNTERKAAGALGSFCRSLSSERFSEIAHARHGREAGRRSEQFEVREYQRLIQRPYARVEIDAHKLDAIFVLTIEGEDGTTHTVTLRRLLVIVVLDAASRAVLGHALCLRPTESQTDILTALERALSDAPPMPITEPGLSRRAGAGLPVHLLSNCAFRSMDELAFDNSLAAFSVEFQSQLAELFGARINLGKSATPEGRAFVESFFKKLTENGYQRLPSTTGGSARSPKRRDPEKKAHEYHITLSAAEQILDILAGHYNDTHHDGLHSTPLDYIRRWDARGGLIRHLPRDLHGLDVLYEQTLHLTVRGGVATGTRPYVQHAGARYRNRQLSFFTSAVGKKIPVVRDRRNVALMKAFSPQGEPLGVLKAEGRWGLSPHSLKTRQAIRLLEKNGELSHRHPDPLDNYLAYLKEAARTRRAAANELVRVQRERGEHSSSEHALEVEVSPTSVRSALRTELTLGADLKIQRATRTGGR
jgi:putative transposase